MGDGRWRSDDWSGYSSKHTAGRSTADIFTKSSMMDEINPALIEFRESRDSASNPRSTPIIVGSDVTGSMGKIAETIIREGLNTMATEIYNRKPVQDPHIMIAAIGDVRSDTAPLQVTQFEADIRLAEQLRNLYIEGRGGANFGESYMTPWLFAATKVVADAIEKRGEKGYIFTIGDEPIHDGLTVAQMKRFLGLNMERDLTTAEILAMAQRNWEVYHILLVNEGACRGRPDETIKNWKALMPENLILLEDYTKIAETIVSTLQILNGARVHDVASSWSGDTSLVVANALHGVATRGPAATGIVAL